MNEPKQSIGHSDKVMMLTSRIMEAVDNQDVDDILDSLEHAKLFIQQAKKRRGNVKVKEIQMGGVMTVSSPQELKDLLDSIKKKMEGGK